MQWGLFMFRHSQGQISGTRSVSFFSSEDLPKIEVIQTYAYTGANQNILVPFTGFCEYILWGAAGSRGTFSSPLRGGAGGATTGILAVTGGETLIAIVGQGGLSTNNSVQSRAGGYGGSGSCSGDGGFFPGRGGGRSAIRRTSTELATAGGGGGASYGVAGSEGGVGGGTTGGSAGGDATSGGGTQSAGGTGSLSGTDGSSLQGGDAAIYGGSGGGGLFGGGGGGNSSGGAGGSGFAGGTSALTYQGTGATPPLNTNPRYPGGGVGASNVDNDQAGHGFIHLRFFL